MWAPYYSEISAIVTCGSARLRPVSLNWRSLDARWVCDADVEFSSVLALSGVDNNFGVDIVGDHLDDGECRALDLVGLEGRERPEELVWASDHLLVDAT